MWKNSKKQAYTPTLIVTYGAIFGEYYWYQHTMLGKRKIAEFYAKSNHRSKEPASRYDT